MACFGSNMLLMVMRLALTFLLLSLRPCDADNNAFRSSLCSMPGAENPSWTVNLNTVFTSLEANVNQNNGYYKAEAGENSDKVYGLIQCRGDVSPSDCSECTRDSFNLASESCDTSSKNVIIWQKWCYLRYSNASFYGAWERSGSAMSNDTSLDDPMVAATGLRMMVGLAGTAPNETLMFAKSEIDVGSGGKRYGAAQCTRDLGKSECGDCLNYLLTAFPRVIEMKRKWEVYGVGCGMWYDDSQFYFDTSKVVQLAPSPTTMDEGSVTTPSAGNRAQEGRYVVLGLTIFAIAMAFL